MKTEKAEALNELILGSVSLIKAVLDASKEDLPKLVIPKDHYNPEVFEQLYDKFEDELVENIKNYQNISIIYDYLHISFPKYDQYANTIYHANKQIIQQKFEVEFLLKLKETIIEYVLEINSLCNKNGKRLKEVMVDVENNTFYYKAQIVRFIEKVDERDFLDNRFIFREMKETCDSLATTPDKIKLIHDRTHDFRQYRLEQIRRYPRDGEIRLNATYPKFMELCNIEIERLEKQWEIERKIRDTEAPLTRIVNETPFTEYAWAGSDTDLIELITSLHLCKTIVRRDGKAITRAEMLKSFGDLFQRLVKDPKSKLNSAANRKGGYSPFLDSLRQAFNTYCTEADNKSTKKNNNQKKA